MNIEFTCTNILDYDAENQRYVQCGAEISAPREESGNRMKCPSCGEWIEVPVASTRQSNAQTGQPVGEAVSLATESIATGHDQLTAGVDSFSQLEDEFAESAETIADTGAALQFDAFNLTTRCPKCSKLLDKRGACTSCKYGHEEIRLPPQKPVKHMEIKTAGFSRWVENRLSGGVTLKMMIGGVYAFSLIVAIVCLLMAVGLGGAWAIVWLFVMAPFAFVLVFTTVIWLRCATTHHNKLQWWQQIGWDLMLSLCRSGNWWRKQELIIKDLDEKTYDHQIAVLPKLGKIQVLDLEGTQLSDAGLLRLYEYGNIQCLVVRNTQVTLEGVLRFQQHFRNIWVWY